MTATETLASQADLLDKKISFTRLPAGATGLLNGWFENCAFRAGRGRESPAS